MDALGSECIILVGNSAGSTLPSALTLMHLDLVQALIQVDAAIYQTMPDSSLLDWLLNTPQVNRIGLLITR